jgi:PAS domain S-box-containing protein
VEIDRLTLLLHIMTNSSQSGLITLFSETDKQGRILFANEAFCEISKYSRDELIGEPHSIIRHPDIPKKLFEVLWNAIEDAKTFRGLIKNRAKDGSHYWVQCTIMPILNNNGQTLKYVGVQHLITNEETARELFASQSASFGID